MTDSPKKRDRAIEAVQKVLIEYGQRCSRLQLGDELKSYGAALAVIDAYRSAMAEPEKEPGNTT